MDEFFVVFESRDISPIVLEHLYRVNLPLFYATVVSNFAVYLHLWFKVGPLISTLPCIGCIVWLFFMALDKKLYRVFLLMAAAILVGDTICSLIDLAIEIDWSLLNIKLAGRGVTILCFETTTLLATGTQTVYLSGLLFSGIVLYHWLNCVSPIIGKSVAVYKFKLYWGLMLIAVGIILKTPRTIEKANSGDLDYTKHALYFLARLLAEILIRVLSFWAAWFVVQNEFMELDFVL